MSSTTLATSSMTLTLTSFANSGNRSEYYLIQENGSSYEDSNSYEGDYEDNQVRNILLQPPRIISLILGFFAVTLNIMSLLALSQIKNRITTHHRLIVSLAISDMMIGFTVVLHFVGNAVIPVYRPGVGPEDGRLQSRCTFMVIKALNSTGLNISLLNLMAMAVDHHMAIIKPLHYPSRMNRKNAHIMISLMWTTAFILGFSNFLSGGGIYRARYPRYNYCEAVYLSKYQDEYLVLVMTFMATVVLCYIYSHIYCTIKAHRTPGESSSMTNNSRLELSRNKRALMTTMLILGTFMLCWIPICIYQITLLIQVHVNKAMVYRWMNTLFIIDQYILDLLLLNSIADPIIYAVRMYDIQLGYRRLIKACLPHSKWETNNVYTTTRIVTAVNNRNSSKKSLQPITDETGIALQTTILTSKEKTKNKVDSVIKKSERTSVTDHSSHSYHSACSECNSRISHGSNSYHSDCNSRTSGGSTKRQIQYKGEFV